jgi:4-amino-4-deoxy-L-arabinose transferase-like glycosyltransferase
MAEDAISRRAITADGAFQRYGLLAAIIVAALTLVRLAVIATSAMPLSVDEAQYWLWSRDPAFGYYSKPPLLAWIIAATTSQCGDGEACVRLSAPILHGVTAALVFALARRLFDARVALWSAVGYAALPGVSVSAVIASTDVPLLLCWTLALYAWVRLCEAGAWVWWAVLGAALGLGVLGKYAMAFFVPCAVVHVALDPGVRQAIRPRGVLPALGIALTLALPNILWNAGHDFVTYRHTAAAMGLDQDLFRPDLLGAFLASQFALFGPLMMAAFIAAAVTVLRSPTVDGGHRLLLSFSVPILAAIAAQSLLSGANANWAAPAYVAATVLASAWCLDTNRATWLQASLVLHLVAGAVLYNFDTLTAATGIAPKRSWDPAVQLRGWDRAGAWAGELQRAHPGVKLLFDERTTMAEVMYYARPDAFDAVMWNPRRTVNNYFEMTTDPLRHMGEDFIYITRRGDANALAASFDRVQALDAWAFAAYPGHRLALTATMLRGFHGYAPATGSGASP